MEDVKKYVEIEDNELARLQRLDGRVDAVQDYVDVAEWIDERVLMVILGIDLTKYEMRKQKHERERAISRNEKKGGAVNGQPYSSD